MSTQETAIIVDNVSKNFKLPHEKVDSVKNLFVNPFSLKKNRNIEVQYALKNISFEVKKGEFFGIVGRNGSGKSTLLKIIANIYQPSKGKVTINGRLVPFIELGVGFNPELTGRENVYLNGALMGFSDDEVDAKYGEIVAFSEIERFMDQKLKNYSSGMQVRLAFSVATILADSDILLIDEVLAVGDADFQRKCFRYFNELKAKKKTVIFVSHDMDAVREYCTRAVLIDNQEVIGIGSANQIAQRYLRLMSPDKAEQGESDTDGERWGDKTCYMDKVSTQVTKERVMIESTIRATRDCKDPTYGIRIRDEKGNEVCGTNSRLLNTRPNSIRKGEARKVLWSIQNIFGDGKYYIDTAITYDGEHTVADWWDGVSSFVVTRERRTGYAVEPEIKLSEDE